MPDHPKTKPQATWHDLPLELRREIYRHALPRTCILDGHQTIDIRPEHREYHLYDFIPGTRIYGSANPDENVVWLRGNTRLLALNHQIHDECVDMMYGDNIFSIHILDNKIEFRYKYQLPTTRLTPSGAKELLNHFSQRNLLKIKNMLVTIHFEDEHGGMMTYNSFKINRDRVRGVGINKQVFELVGLLGLASRLRTLHIHVDQARTIPGTAEIMLHRVMLHGRVLDTKEAEKDHPDLRLILHPFKDLYGVDRVTMTGVHSATFADELKHRMEGPEPVPNPLPAGAHVKTVPTCSHIQDGIFCDSPKSIRRWDDIP
ncbi:hypothetical protein M011DRAFT_486142 [Sporormia fimetaria CBS 119925]|uniref:Uncharacterized protein n=1 Tax=Sporormia fimetaria CBS 119925 TaxID=1340428 RepID=A0A6A6VAV5_9PLEO|nr:hypothetical protein M011DRAFT_486142 [Sporormia fimetaria CBS 119925]